jgi:hypothetical protein
MRCVKHRRIIDRQPDREDGALFQRTAGGNGSVVFLDDFACHGQAQPGAAIAFGGMK